MGLLPISSLTIEHILLFLYGLGANGKSTLLETIFKIFGEYAQRGSNQLFYVQRNGGRPPELEVAGLAGTRLVIGQENNSSAKLNEEVVKSLSAGDVQRGRFHHQNFFDYTPSLKVVLFGNHRPKIIGTDEGIWRRFLLVEFGVSIPKAEQGPQPHGKAVE